MKNIRKYPKVQFGAMSENIQNKCTASAETQNKQCCKNFAGFTYPVAEKKLVIACAKMSSAANQMMLMSGKCRP